MIISFSGRIGSGKDTAAQIVQELYPEMNWQVKGFADKLRQVASIFLGIPPEELKKQEVKMQFLGPEWDYFKSHYRLDGKRYDVDGIFGTATAALIAVHESGYSEGCDEYQMRIRNFLQILGTDAIRDKLHPNSWVNALMVDYKPIGARINNLIPCNVEMVGGEFVFSDKCRPLMPNWLVTDCRYPNEVEAIKSRGGTCIRIVRPDNPYPQSNHESETAIDHIEMLTIINDGNLEQLKLRIREAVEPIIKNAKSH